MYLLYSSSIENQKLLYKKPVWNKGTKGLQVAWNKGKQFSEKQKENMSKGQVKRFQDPKQRKKVSLKQKEIYQNPKAIEKNRQAQLKYNKEHPYHIEKMSQITKNLFQNIEYKGKHKQSQQKRWLKSEEHEKASKSQKKRFSDPKEREKASKSKLHIFSALDKLIINPYCHLFNKKLKEQVRIRDSYICQNCGITQEESISKYKQILHIHHIHYDKSNCFPDLITLCAKCNSTVNFNRIYWEKYFMNKLNDRQLLFWTKRKNKI